MESTESPNHRRLVAITADRRGYLSAVKQLKNLGFSAVDTVEPFHAAVLQACPDISIAEGTGESYRLVSRPLADVVESIGWEGVRDSRSLSTQVRRIAADLGYTGSSDRELTSLREAVHATAPADTVIFPITTQEQRDCVTGLGAELWFVRGDDESKPCVSNSRMRVLEYSDEAELDDEISDKLNLPTDADYMMFQTREDMCEEGDPEERYLALMEAAALFDRLAYVASFQGCPEVGYAISGGCSGLTPAKLREYRDSLLAQLEYASSLDFEALDPWYIRNMPLPLGVSDERLIVDAATSTMRRFIDRNYRKNVMVEWPDFFT